jgi:CheY-like chemotaxis protein
MYRILIVDDDDTLRNGYCSVLELEGHDVRTAVNGRQALMMLSGEWLPHAIFLDLTMPVMDGWEFRTAQKSDPRLCDIPIIVLSGAGDESVEDFGATGQLRKPFLLDDMLDVIGSLVRPDWRSLA